jgi:hypothetical protein
MQPHQAILLAAKFLLFILNEVLFKEFQIQISQKVLGT